MPRTALPASSKDYTPSSGKERTNFATIFSPKEEPKTELGRYRILAPTAGIRVSPLCLGAMSIGDQWSGFMGSALNYDKAEEFLDYFYEAGGNFIDTANGYQDEQSEMIIGEWMEKRNNRDEMVIATKYTTFPLDRKEGKFDGIGANYVGNSKKSMRLSVEASLKKLRTDYIDLLYVHWWDYSTSVPEVMQALNDLVKAGKVLYLGVSDTPAWIVAQANEYAKHHGLAQFVVYQGAWNVSMRDMERDVIPMARAHGMSIAPWAALGQGKFKTPEEVEERKKAGTLRAGAEPTETEIKISKVLKEISDELGGGVKLPNIAMAWARQTVADCFPIIGGSSIEYLKSNIDALKIHLTEEQLEKLNNAVPFDWGFPYAHFGRDPHYLPGGVPNNALLTTAAHHQFIVYP
ncbi:aryl-alcohol dehydrogenase [Kwoniella heveanensis BCC8398]|uniref:Aryl-alcohol dehydrogenase n=1 Tax=Kwoniella heveanensis BCC8398 TaxID=1296120 RepID=A0A1B9GY98_9TREE|nr:aryl-alcohol dehydrogenase [Kwoniella heveanensis BCC8398]